MSDADLAIVGGGQSGLATAHIAHLMGLSTLVLEADFTGRVLHSADYRNGQEFTDQRFILIGTGYSANQPADGSDWRFQSIFATHRPIQEHGRRIAGRTRIFDSKPKVSSITG